MIPGRINTKNSIPGDIIVNLCKQETKRKLYSYFSEQKQTLSSEKQLSFLQK